MIVVGSNHIIIDITGHCLFVRAQGNEYCIAISSINKNKSDVFLEPDVYLAYYKTEEEAVQALAHIAEQAEKGCSVAYL